MDKPEVFKYTWKADQFGYEISYNQTLIGGLCTNIHLYKRKEHHLLYIKHQEEAKKELLKILKDKKLWQRKAEKE